MKIYTYKLWVVILTSSLIASCSIDVELNAPEKDIWAVFGTLNPKDSVQNIRISSGYLPESNALDYARENDLSVKGLNVVLSDGVNQWKATEVSDIVKEPEDGTFYPFTTIYQFHTTGANALIPGNTYSLRITKPDNADFELIASTSIPEDMTFQNISPVPGGPGGQQRCLRPAAIEGEYKLEFSKGTGASYELRVFLDYKENGVSKTAVYGPTAMFSENFRCNAGGGSSSSRCYTFREKIILQSLYNQLKPEAGKILTYGLTESTRCNVNVNDLPDDFRVEVTAMDQNLANYRLANDPKYLDLNTIRPEYSNINGPEDAVILGVLGSINTGIGKVRLSSCAEYLLQLNNARQPNEPCEL
ncbi:MAG: DUF4249 family protein [Bacteroidetes bacterium]|nr:DUF4249 family protein [Bacteroidota bacterium]